MTSFNAINGRDPPSILQYGSQSLPLQTVDELLQARDRMLSSPIDKLYKAMAIMKDKSDQYR